MRKGIACVVAYVAFAMPAIASAEVLTARFSVDKYAFDLETGTLYDRSVQLKPPSNFDFWFAYHANLLGPLRLGLFHNTPHVTAAFLFHTPFESVDYSDVLSATFQEPLYDGVFPPDETILLRTEEGNYYKIGNAVEVFVQSPYYRGGIVNYEKLVPAPEPSTLTLATLASGGILGLRRRAPRSLRPL